MEGVNTSGQNIGRYRLLEKIGEGGMGVVHLGTDPHGRQVAVKVLRPGVASDQTALRRLAREVDSMRRVRSPHVAEIVDADVTAEPPYVVTQFVPGRTLEQTVRDRGPLRLHELQRLATPDVLTQSSNRRYFFDNAEQAFNESKQAGTALAFLLLDVDDFKKVNDRYGHQVGDRVLQRVAQCASGALRRGDLFGRIGGEEFAVLLPGCDQVTARQIGERLQREVQRLRFKEDEQTFGISVSQGLTLLQPHDENLSALYGRADAALYQAKRNGKDRIEQA